MVSGFWPFRGCRGRDMNESIKNGKFVTKM